MRFRNSRETKTIGGRTVTAGLLLALAWAALAAEPPATAPFANISNGTVRAKLWLPDPEKGYYQGLRFDWSGSLWSLEADGHSYFGQWFPRYEPKAHGSITGPVEDYAPLNYDEAKPGETFVKIGVGTLKKMDGQPYHFSSVYDLLDTGKWTVRTGPDFVEYRHELSDPKSGFGYIYTKTIRLTPGRQQMTIDHTLKNTGTKPIATNNYNHGFFMLDAQPTGPDVSVTFPFDVKAAKSMSPAAEVRGKQIVYLTELQPNANALAPAGGAPAPARGGGRGAGAGAGGDNAAPTGASSLIEGFSLTDPKDFDIRIENRKSGAGIRVTADRPLWRINFWSTRTTVCPEAYVEVKADPGKETSWRLTYDFYSLPGQ
jgi:hypothetical protein